MTSTFKNEKLQFLYNKLNSYEGYNLRGIQQISTAIYPLVSEVIHDDEAYSEAIFNWPAFQCVVDVLENGDKEYTSLSEEDSMCYSLWWNTNHSMYQEQEDAYADSSILKQVHNYISTTGTDINDNDADYIFI
jgi:hypothetical protein